MKQIIDLRPVYHRAEQRIRAHALLCWLVLLLIRIAETQVVTMALRVAPAIGSRPKRIDEFRQIEPSE